jgi:hypothetical protein
LKNVSSAAWCVKTSSSWCVNAGSNNAPTGQLYGSSGGVSDFATSR